MSTNLSDGSRTDLGPTNLQLQYRRTDTGMSDTERLSIGQMLDAMEKRLALAYEVEADRVIDTFTTRLATLDHTVASILEHYAIERDRQFAVLTARLTFLEQSLSRIESRRAWPIRLWRRIFPDA